MTGVGDAATPVRLAGYFSRLAARWPAGRRHLQVSGTLVCADLTGFTSLTERLAVAGRPGAEELTGLVNRVLSPMIDEALAGRGDVLSFGGDAILVLFRGPGHAPRACRSIAAMHASIAQHGAVESSRGPVRLRMSAAVASGNVDVVAIGERQRALLVVGDCPSRVLRLEAAARPGQTLLSAATAGLLDPRWTSASRLGEGRALRPAGIDAAARRDEPAAAAPGRGARWLPPAVAQALRRTPSLAELRVGGIAFLVAEGLDGRLTRSPDDAVAALIALGARVEETCARLDLTWLGVDAAPDGAKVIIGAGVPETREGDEERLLRGVQEIVGVAPTTLRLRAGASHGGLYVGDLGHPRRRAFTVMGDTVNVAARLAGRAAPGDVLVTHDLVVSSATGFRVQEVAPLAVKGKREPVRALRLGAPAGRRRRALERVLVGRDAERALIVEALSGLRSGCGAVVEVVAPSGMGKTHLVSDALAALPDVQVGRGEGDPFVSSDYSAIAPALRGLLDIPPDADRGTAARRLAVRLASVAPALRPWTPLLAAAMGVQTAETIQTRRLDPRFRAQRLHEVTIELLAALGPVAVVIDDLQWADDASLALLEALARSAAANGWAIVGLRRPVGWSLSDAVPETVRTDLSPLSRADAERLVVEAVGDRGIVDDALGDVVDRAGGHPFFLLQLVRALQSGLADLPADVERLTAVRLDRLDPRDRLLVREASVAGPEAELALLAEALGDARIGTPERWRSLGEFVDVRDGRAIFRHDMYRETAYARLPVARRAEVHRRLGAALLQRTPAAEMPDLAPTLATHFDRAGEVGDAWRFARQAARAAERRAAWAEAARMCEVAVRARTRVDGPHAAATVRMSLRRARALLQLGRLMEALSALPRPRGPDLTGRFKTEMLRADLLTNMGRFPAALRSLRRAEAAAHEGGGSLSTVLARRASVLREKGQRRHALRVAHDAHACARTAVERGRASLQIAAAGLGDVPGAPTFAMEALTLLRSRDHELERGHVLVNLGVLAFRTGRWPEAVSLYDRGGRAYAKAGYSIGLAMVANNQAELAYQQDDLDRAAHHLVRTRRVMTAAGDLVMVALCDVLDGSIAARKGDLDGADRLLAGARAALERLGAVEYVLDADIRLAEVLLWRTRAGEALDAVLACVREVARLGLVSLYAGWVDRLRACALHQLGRTDEADQLVRRLVDDARRAGDKAELVRCLLTSQGSGSRAGLPPDRARDEEITRLAGALGLVRLPPPPLGQPPAFAASAST